MQMSLFLVLCVFTELALAQRRPQNGGGNNGRSNGGNNGGRRPNNGGGQPNNGGRPNNGGGNNGGRPDQPDNSDRPDNGGDRPDNGGDRPDRPDQPDGGDRPVPQPNIPEPALRVQCSRARRWPQDLSEPYDPIDACDLTQQFESFAAGYAAQSVCDGLFNEEGEEELKVFCNVIKQTVDEFQAVFSTDENPDYWCNADNTFPFICNGRSPSVCGICTTIQSAFVSSSCNPNYDTLVRDVLALFSVQPQCEVAMRSTGRRNNPQYGYGFTFCNYVFQINGDFGCEEWTNIVASCDPSLSTMECFQSRLFSTLNQTAGYVLYESEVCEKSLATASSGLLV